ncbi:hypothetical protein M0R04_15875 [Candidatus Dojkabacteria bacterium]|jgi:hypothetical protein|nr:hypothetical protein [Candidatus Dojkabacteria bacterium]
MPIYQQSTVTDGKVEVGNYAMYVASTAGTTVGGSWINLGAGMVKTLNYTSEPYTSQSGNSVDPIQGIARETCTIDIDLIEYDGSSFSVLSGGSISGTSGSLLVGGQTNVMAGKGLKLVNTRKLATGSTQTTTYVFNYVFLNGGFSTSPKSDNDTDPVNLYSFSILAKQYLTAQTIFTKTVA